MNSNYIANLKTTSLVIFSTIIFVGIIEASAYLIIKSNGTGYYQSDFKNSLNLRDPKEPEDTLNKRVVLILGDSFTYGLGVKYENSYPRLLENKLQSNNSDLVVVNAGKPGFDTKNAYERLQRIYEHYMPDIVILGFHSADIFQNQRAFKKHIENTALQRPKDVGVTGTNTNIKHQEADLPIIILIKEFIRKNSNTGALINYLYKNYLIKYLSPPTKVKNYGSGVEFRATEFYLDEIKNFMAHKNKKFILLNLVPLIRFDSYPYNMLNEQLLRYTQSRNLLFINPIEELSKYQSSNLSVSIKDGHYNKLANQVVSNVIESAIIEHDLLEKE